MAKNPARYAVTFGLIGCYLPDSEPYAFEALTRAELAERIRRTLGFIKRNGSSVAHFSIQHGAYEIAFHGLTQEEFAAYESVE